jgi:hypothetical protein
MRPVRAVRDMDHTGIGRVSHEGVRLQEELTGEVLLAGLLALCGLEEIHRVSIELGQLGGALAVVIRHGELLGFV